MLTIANSNSVSIASDSIISSNNKNKTTRIDANYIYVNSNSTIDQLSFIKIIFIDPTPCIPNLYLILKRLQVIDYSNLFLVLIHDFISIFNIENLKFLTKNHLWH